MGLFAPWFLAGVAAIGLPIYLHLLRRHTTTPKPFSSLMFFEPRTQSSIRHRRLRYLLLLALRMALLVLLALAFANPFIMRPAAKVPHDTLTMLVIDTSFSMRAGTRLADAKREAAAVLAAKKGSAPVQVMSLDAQLHTLMPPGRDSSTAKAAIDSARAGDGRSSYAEMVRAVRLMEESSHQPIVLHLFSDMQRSSLASSFSELVMPEGVTLVLHPVVKSGEPNWTIESVTAPAQLFGGPKGPVKPVRVRAIVAGFGTPAATRRVSLIVNGNTAATQDVQVAANGRATVEFSSLDVPYGFSKCEVRLDGADKFPGDDGFVFAVERSDPQLVLFVHGESDTRSPLYFTNALNSAAESAFELQSVTLEQLATSGLSSSSSLSKYAFVVLSNVSTLSSGLERDLLTYVREGGNLWLAIGTAAAGRSRVPVFGDDIVTIHDYARELGRGRERFLSVGESDASHVAMNAAGQLPGVKFYYAVGVDASNARVIARLTDRTPLLLEKTIGEGRVLLFTSGLDNLTNDFPLHPAFVAFVEQTARYLSGTERRAGSHIVDSYLELRKSHDNDQSANGNGSANANAAGSGRALGVEVIDPEGHRPISLNEASTAASVRLTQAGFYQVRLANGRQEVVGVNPDRRESNLDVIPDDVLASWRGKPQPENAAAGVAVAATDGAGAADPPEQREPYSLWWHIMILALAAALVESWLAGRYLGAQREES